MSQASTDPRPFRVLGLQQVALGGSDRAKLRALWVDLLGVTLTGQHESPTENVREDLALLGSGLGAVELNLMEPIDPAGRPDVSNPALNHIGLWVDRLAEAKGWLEAQGVRFAPGGIRKGAAGHDVCFIHPRPSDAEPRSGEGVLIELVQAPEELIAAFQGRN